ncbi:retrotransposon protein, putative, ty1-copia subclass [Tanacetum coccineum]
MLKREKLSGTNFNDWFRLLRLFFRVEKKLFTIEQPIPPAPVTRSTNQEFEKWNKIYDVRNEVACLMLGSMNIDLQRQYENFSPHDMLQELKFIVGLILNGLTSDFAGFIRNYNMHNMGKTTGEIHALLIEYENGLPKKSGTSKVLVIQGGRIQKPNKKPQATKGNEHPTKDDVCHHCKEVGHWMKNCLVYLTELMKKKKQDSTASTLGIFTIELFSFLNKSWVYDTGCGTHICNTKHGLRCERKLKQGTVYLYLDNGIRAQVEAIGSFDLLLPNGFEDVKRDTPGKLQQRPVKCIFVGYPKETMGYYFYFPPKNKIIVARFSEFLEKNLISQKAMEEHSLGDLNEPDNYKSALLNLESNKWLDVMNAEMQSMIANQVWRLVDLPPYGKTIRSVDSDRTP